MTDDFPPEYWTSRAEEARALAEQMHAPESRKTMLEIAAGYEYLAAAAMRLRQYKHTGVEELGGAPLTPTVKCALS